MKKRFRVDWRPLSELKTHPRVQRGFQEAWARAIKSDFDPDRFGTLSVLLLSGRYLVFDGQHRAWAALQVLGPDQKVPCHVYEGLSDEECASIAHGLNTRKAWRAVDSFLNRVRFDSTAQEIDRTIRRHGLKVAGAFQPGVVRAVGACEWVYGKCSAKCLDRTLGILKAAWPSYAETWDQWLIRGLGLLLEQYGDELNEGHLRQRLAGHGNPVRILGHARELSRVAHKTMPRAVSSILLEEYNKKLRTGRLGAGA